MIRIGIVDDHAIVRTGLRQYLSDHVDLRVTGEGGSGHDALEMARAVGGAAALADWRGEEVLPGPGLTTLADKRAFLEKAAFTHHHPVGTCRMGTGEDTVVDSGMRVRGMEGLSVCDASVIPTITTGPINAAIVAMAERTSDLFKSKAPLAPFVPEGMQS